MVSETVRNMEKTGTIESNSSMDGFQKQYLRFSTEPLQGILDADSNPDLLRWSNIKIRRMDATSPTEKTNLHDHRGSRRV